MTSRPNAIEQAAALLGMGDRAQAIALIQRAVDAGDADAMFQAALWRLGGDPLPRDLPRAHLLLRGAAQGGHPDAALMEIALIGNGSGTPEDWPRALALLEAVAGTDPVAADQLGTLRRMNLTSGGDPKAVPTADILSDDPFLARFPALLTREECNHLIDAANGFLAPAVVVDPSTGKMVSHPIRTSDGAIISPARENLVIRALNRRLAAISGTHANQGEPLSILRYAPGQQYRLHSDALPGGGNQRILTVLVYLNDNFEGGETDFPELGITVRPAVGDAIVFRNTLNDGRMDPRMMHAGLPVLRGVKWLATRWIRAAPYDPWTAR